MGHYQKRYERRRSSKGCKQRISTEGRVEITQNERIRRKQKKNG